MPSRLSSRGTASWRVGDSAEGVTVAQGSRQRTGSHNGAVGGAVGLEPHVRWIIGPSEPAGHAGVARIGALTNEAATLFRQATGLRITPHMLEQAARTAVGNRPWDGAHPRAPKLTPRQGTADRGRSERHERKGLARLHRSRQADAAWLIQRAFAHIASG